MILFFSKSNVLLYKDSSSSAKGIELLLNFISNDFSFIKSFVFNVKNCEVNKKIYNKTIIYASKENCSVKNSKCFSCSKNRNVTGY